MQTLAHITLALGAPDQPAPIFQLLGRLHPIVVHFPIALLIVAVMVEGWVFVQKRGAVSPTGVACLGLGTAGAAVSAGLGWIYAWAEETGGLTGDQSRTLELHRWLGVGTVGVALLAVAACVIARKAGTARAANVYRVTLLGAAVVVGLTGHIGGEMVYGETYLSEALGWVLHGRPDVKPAATAPVAGRGEVIDYARQVVPILEAECYECHGEKKVKGNLRVDTIAAMLKGGKGGPAIAPGDGVHSLLMVRIRGEGGKAQMPKDYDPLTDEEVRVLTLWIQQGAKGN